MNTKDIVLKNLNFSWVMEGGSGFGTMHGSQIEISKVACAFY